MLIILRLARSKFNWTVPYKSPATRLPAKQERNQPELYFYVIKTKRVVCETLNLI